MKDVSVIIESQYLLGWKGPNLDTQLEEIVLIYIISMHGVFCY